MNVKIPHSKNPVMRAMVEVGFIVFLFYSNLMMGEYTRSAPAGKTFAAGVTDIFTPKNFGIAIVSAFVGFMVFEYLREKS
jgi:hypothetical protein